MPVALFQASTALASGGKQALVAIDNPPPSRHDCVHKLSPGGSMVKFFRNICRDEAGQDIAEYAVMLAVILVLVIGTVRLIGTNANNAFSQVASSLQ